MQHQSPTNSHTHRHYISSVNLGHQKRGDASKQVGGLWSIYGSGGSPAAYSGDPLRCLEEEDAEQREGVVEVDTIEQRFNKSVRTTSRNLTLSLENATGAVNQASHAMGDDTFDQIGAFQDMSLWLTRRPYFDPLFCSLVCINIVLVVIQVDMDTTPQWMLLASIALDITFAGELIVRIMASPKAIFRDRILMFDACVISIAWVDIFIEMQGVPLEMDFITILRVIRLGRLLNAGVRFKHLYLLRVLTEAMQTCASPMLAVVAVSLISILSCAVMLTTLVGAAATDSEEVKPVLLAKYGSVMKSCLSLLEGMSGSSDWGTEIGFKLLQQARQNKLGSLIMFIAVYVSYFVLRLGLNGVVTAIFLESLFSAGDREDSEDAGQEFHAQNEIVKDLNHMFKNMGFSKTDTVPWEDIHQGLLENPGLLGKLNMSMEEVEELYNKCDGDGLGGVSHDDFIFALFKQLAISKSVDMLSVDYQQEQALLRIQELHQGLKFSVASLQSRLSALFSLLPQLEDEIGLLRRGMQEIRNLEESLQEKRATRKAMVAGGLRTLAEIHPGHELLGGLPQSSTGAQPSSTTARVPNIWDIRANSELNKKLEETEKRVANLLQAPDGAHEADDDLTSRHIERLADSIVLSVKLSLQQEMDAARQDSTVTVPNT
eukprot:TRINITY_DN41713_c0_g1_i1.p1 TRINITY_DN41713_c0_g1~~TRINITY_DN41713_c0_g1_i1.p1  ORF type:complete len:658 (+),score=167.50 TRINITY_DN41713_c0_g1_i1:192-2165(+)